MPTENPRFTLTVPEALYNRIKDYQYDNRLKNQTQAVLALIAKGLDLEETAEAMTDHDMQLIMERYGRMDSADKRTFAWIANLMLCQDKYKE